jgi:hypothetical protein
MELLMAHLSPFLPQKRLRALDGGVEGGPAAKLTLGEGKAAAREEAITLPLHGDLQLLNLGWGDLFPAFPTQGLLSEGGGGSARDGQQVGRRKQPLGCFLEVSAQHPQLAALRGPLCISGCCDHVPPWANICCRMLMASSSCPACPMVPATGALPAAARHASARAAVLPQQQLLPRVAAVWAAVAGA